jgi:hypothetical protein
MMSSYKSPTNSIEYWNIVNTYWEDIRLILDLYLPTFKNQWIDGSELDRTLGEYIEILREEKNPRIVRVFNAAWFAAPDDMGIWNNSSWGKFCDLCSEEWCLHEEKETDN